MIESSNSESRRHAVRGKPPSYGRLIFLISNSFDLL